MKKYVSLGLLLTLILVAEPSKLSAIDEPRSTPEDRGLTRESIGRRLRELLDRLKENFTFEISGEERAPISLMLRNRERLGLTGDQVKQLEQLRGFVKSMEAKLGNEAFVSRAPAEVVQQQRDSLAEKQAQIASTEAALAKLK